MQRIPSDIIEDIQKWAVFVRAVLSNRTATAPEQHHDYWLRQVGLLAAVETAQECNTGINSVDQVTVADVAGVRHAVMASELQSLTSAFTIARIDCRVLKGMAANLTLYAGIEGARPLSDIDLLVPPDQFVAAAKALEASGFNATKTNNDVHNPRVNQIGLIKTMGAFTVPVDLHRQAHNWPLLHTLAKDAFSTSNSTTVHGIPLLAPPLSMSWNIAHRMKDFYAGDLRGLLDLVLMSGSMSIDDIDTSGTLIEIHGLLKPAWLTVQQAQFWFGEMPELNHCLHRKIDRRYSRSTLRRWTDKAIALTTGNFQHVMPRTLRAYQGAFETEEHRRDAIRALLTHSIRRR